MTKTLPPDPTRVWYQIVENFDCDGVFIFKTIDGYKVRPLPWKK